MRRLLVMMLLIALFLPPVTHGQDNEPRLSNPTPDRYLDGWLWIAQVPGASDAALRTLQAEMLYRYPDTFPAPSGNIDCWFFDQYMARDLSFDELSWTYLNYVMQYSAFDQRAWNNVLITRWLEENPVDLDHVEQLTFGFYTIDVLPRDFNADGVHEWQLTVTSPLTMYFVAQRAGDRLRLITVPLTWAGGSTFYSWSNGAFEELGFEDINADGLPEWIMAYGGVPGGHKTRGDLTILSWRDDRLESIGRATYIEASGGGPRILPHDTDWEFVNLDDDPALELHERAIWRDAWDCDGTHVTIFDWDGNTYVEGSPVYEHENTLECVLLQAELRMWEHDYAAAVPLYEQGIALYEHEPDDNIARERWQYGRIRLTLAYALTGRNADAGAILAALAAEEPASGMIADLVDRLTASYTATPTALGLCSAAYRVFEDYRAAYIYYDLPSAIHVGYADDVYSVRGLQAGQNDYPPPPADAGCDAVTLVFDMAFAVNFASEDSATLVLYPPEPEQSIAINAHRSLLWDLPDRLGHDDLNVMLSDVETALADITDSSDEGLLLGLRYWRAFLLDELGYEDVATAAYLDLWNESENGTRTSAWCKLALLHLEGVGIG